MLDGRIQRINGVDVVERMVCRLQCNASCVPTLIEPVKVQWEGDNRKADLRLTQAPECADYLEYDFILEETLDMAYKARSFRLSLWAFRPAHLRIACLSQYLN